MPAAADLPAPPATEALTSAHARALALVVAGAFFMENLDGTVIVTALPAMAHSFGKTAVDLNLGITVYLLTLAVFIPLSGWVAHRFGVRRIFIGALALFTLSSALCGLSKSLPAFLAARILQGFAGAMMVPVGRLAVLNTTPKENLVRAIALVTWPGLAAPVIGPPLGGLLSTYATWHWIFFLNLPFGLLGVLLALKLLPRDSGGERLPFDAPGFLLTAIACAGLMIGLDAIGHPGSERTAAAILAASLLAGGLAIRHLRRGAHPLIDLSTLRVPTFAVTILGGSLFRVAISALPFLLPLLFQISFQLTAFASGMFLLAMFLGNLLMKPFTTAVLRRFGFRTTLLGNGFIAAAGIFACAGFSAGTPHWLIATLLFIGGLARSMQFTSINTLAFADVPPALMNGANTLFSMVQQLTMGLGVAVGAIALRAGSWLHADSASSSNGLPGQSAAPADFRIAFIAMGAVALLGLLDCLTLSRHAAARVSGHRAEPPSP